MRRSGAKRRKAKDASIRLLRKNGNRGYERLSKRVWGESVDMPFLASAKLADILRCPRCGSPLSDDHRCVSPECMFSEHSFDEIDGQLVLIDFHDSIVQKDRIAPAQERSEGLVQRVLQRAHPPNAVARKICARIVDEVRRTPGDRPRILIVGGGTLGSGLEDLNANPDLDIVSFDVFPSRFTQFVADGHRIPLADASVDAVIIQAVLEHVLEPTLVVSEIYRVLRPHGLVYGDTPFLQHVHEGAFDFTRFTESGHRWLFRNFTLIESGVVAGTGTQLAWSVAHAVRSVVPFKGISSLTRLVMAPIASLIDSIASRSHAIDGASSVYFYGRKSDRPIRPSDMIEHYQGAQRRPSRLA